jgi:DNA invertase Pin-like site-specific DNA recombinase
MRKHPSEPFAKKKQFRVAITTRVSTDDQARGEYSSLKSQRDICEHYIQIHADEGWSTTHYFEDAGYSGKDMERPGIQELLAEVRAGNVDVVVAYKIDRISRFLPDFYDFWRVLEQYGVHFVSATQQFDTSTPMGMLMLNMLLSFAQFEREMIAERTAHKLAERAKRGKWNGGWVPLGFCYDKTTKLLGPHPEENDLLVDIYKLAVKLRNATKVANALNEAGRRTRQRVLIRPDGTERIVGEKRFREDRIKAIIQNPIYKGVIAHDGDEYPSEHPALVSAELWTKANEAIKVEEQQRLTLQERDKHVHLLKGILKCGHCGTALTPYPSGKKDPDGNPYLYYTCTHVTKDGSDSECPVRSIPARPFDDLIIRYLGEIGRHPDVIEASIKASNEEKLKALRPLKSKLAELDRRYRELSAAVQNCIETAKRKGAKSISDEFMQEAEKLSKEKRQIELDRTRLNLDINHRENVVADAQIIADALLQFQKVIRKLNDDEQKELVRLIVREISVKHFDPTIDAEPGGKGVFSAQIRTKWYLVNMSLFASGLFPETWEIGKISSDLKKIGSRGRARTYNPSVNSRLLYH